MYSCFIAGDAGDSKYKNLKNGVHIFFKTLSTISDSICVAIPALLVRRTRQSRYYSYYYTEYLCVTETYTYLLPNFIHSTVKTQGNNNVVIWTLENNFKKFWASIHHFCSLFFGLPPYIRKEGF